MGVEDRSPRGLPKPGSMVKTTGSDKEASILISPQWLQKIKLAIGKLVEPYEAKPVKLAPGITGAELGEIEPGVRVFAVDADQVMLRYDMDFVVAGNHQRWKWIPNHTIWVDKEYKVADMDHDLLHEAVERRLMEKLGWDYDCAHAYANAIEKPFIRDLIAVGKKAQKEVAVCPQCGKLPCTCKKGT